MADVARSLTLGQKETADSKTVSLELFTDEDEVLRLKRREKIRDKKFEEISDSLQLAKENIDNLCSEIKRVKN